MTLCYQVMKVGVHYDQQRLVELGVQAILAEVVLQVVWMMESELASGLEFEPEAVGAAGSSFCVVT